MEMLIVFGAKYLIIVSVAALLWSLYILKGKKRQYLIGLTVVALPVAFLLSRVAGHFYYNARPFVVGNFTPLISHAADNGFPSDHMLLAALLATLVFFVNARLGTIAWVVALLVGLSRVAAGVHHTGDIVGSAIISIIAVFIAHYILFLSKKIRV